MSYTHFLQSLGIKDSDRDPEFLSLIEATIDELYDLFGIVLYKDFLTTSSIINGAFNTPLDLAYKTVSNVSIAGYTENTDYTIDSSNGTITILSTGTMLENTDYTINYSYVWYNNKWNEFTYRRKLNSDNTTYNIYLTPINSINSVTFGADTWVDGVDYEIFDSELEVLNSSITNYKQWLTITADVGYETLPRDLERAFYDYVLWKWDRHDKKTDTIISVETTQDSLTKYTNKTPSHLLSTFQRYSKRPLALA